MANGVRTAVDGATPNKRPAAAAAPKPVKLTTPARVGALPRMTSADAKAFERGLTSKVPAGAARIHVGWYGRGATPTYELRALQPLPSGRAASESMLRMYATGLSKAGLEVGPTRAVAGGLSCARVAARGSVCAWSGPKSRGVVMWFSGTDVRKLGAVTTKARGALEGR